MATEIYCNGTAKIINVQQNRSYELKSADIRWESVSDDSGPDGDSGSLLHIGTVRDVSLGLEHVTWHIREYRNGDVKEETHTDSMYHIVLEDFEYGLKESNPISEESQGRAVAFSSDFSSDFDNGLTENAHNTLSKDEQVTYMSEWFHERFEDPAHSTPYNTREGGYQYIRGGPYDADEVLQENFSDDFSLDVISQAVEAITEDGTYNWSPVDDGSTVDPNELPEEDPFDLLGAAIVKNHNVKFGDPQEQKLREPIVDQLHKILAEVELSSKSDQWGGIGHNQPPLDDSITPNYKDIHPNVQSLITELGNDEPDLSIVHRCGIAIRDWFANGLSIASDNFFKTMGFSAGGIGTAIVFSPVIPERLWEIGKGFFESISSWIQFIV